MNFNFLQNLIPPDDPRKLNKWRWFIAVALVVLIFDGLSGRGLILPAGSYAYASDVAQNAKKIDRILVLNYAREIRNLRIDECKANGNKSAIRSAMEQFQQEYKELTGDRYPILSCQELKIT